MSKKKTATLSFKIDEDFKKRLAERAEEENRNMSNFVINILTKYLDEVDRAKKLIGGQ